MIETRRRRPEAAEPGAARPRTKPSEVRRRELLDAGEVLVLRKGIAGTGIDDIVAAADVPGLVAELQVFFRRALGLG